MLKLMKLYENLNLQRISCYTYKNFQLVGVNDRITSGQIESMAMVSLHLDRK